MGVLCAVTAEWKGPQATTRLLGHASLYLKSEAEYREGADRAWCESKPCTFVVPKRLQRLTPNDVADVALTWYQIVIQESIDYIYVGGIATSLRVELPELHKAHANQAPA